jgi:hypothetical protein
VSGVVNTIIGLNNSVSTNCGEFLDYVIEYQPVRDSVYELDELQHASSTVN